MRRVAVIAGAMLTTIAAGARKAPPQSSDPVARGRFIYMERCVVCHNQGPNLPGSQGPPIAGSSRELVAARVPHLSYPPGYRPKHNSHAMKAMPELAPQVDAMTAYLDVAASPTSARPIERLRVASAGITITRSRAALITGTAAFD
jgi:mono/diheme cytochrome c family protein